MGNPYSSTNSLVISNLSRSSISLVVFVHTQTFPVSVSNSQWYKLTESVFRCLTLICHCKAKLMPFSSASSSGRLVCWASFISRNHSLMQHHVLGMCWSPGNLCPLIHWHPVSSHTIGPVKDCSTWLWLSSLEPFVVKGQPLWHQPSLESQHWLSILSFPTLPKAIYTLASIQSITHMERKKMACSVTISGTLGIALSCFRCKVPCSPQTSNSNTQTPSSRYSRSLFSSSNQDKCCLIHSTGAMLLLLTYTLTIYANVVCWMVSPLDSTASTIDCIMDGATICPNPMRVR